MSDTTSKWTVLWKYLAVARHDGWPVSDTRMAGRCAPLGWSD